MERNNSAIGTELAISFCDPEAIGRNADFVCQYARQTNPAIGCLRQALFSLQFTGVPWDIKMEHPGLLWDVGDSPFKQTLLSLMDLRVLPTDWMYSAEERIVYEARFSEAMELLETALPRTHQAISMLIGGFLFGRRPTCDAASVSTRIGFVWLAPKEKWSLFDWVENLVHEFIHNALFLEDMVDTVFPQGVSMMAQPDGLALSAIRQQKRGYDKAYHSAFVAYGLCRLYLVLQSPKWKWFFGPLAKCCEDLVRNQKYLSAHGTYLLNDLVSNVIAFGEETGCSKKLRAIMSVAQ